MKITRRIAIGLAAALLTTGMWAGTASAQSTEFFRTLADKELATLEDGMRAVHMLVADGAMGPESYEALRAALQERGLVTDCMPESADDYLTKGDLGFMIRNALGIEGGVTLRVLDQVDWPSGRYSLRECIHEGIIAQGGMWDFVGGPELISVLSRAGDWRAPQPVEVPSWFQDRFYPPERWTWPFHTAGRKHGEDGGE